MLARITSTSIRRLPRVSPMAVRFYSPEDKLSDKERGEENQYARQLEAEQLKKLRAEIAQKKAELAELEKAHKEAEDRAK